MIFFKSRSSMSMCVCVCVFVCVCVLGGLSVQARKNVLINSGLNKEEASTKKQTEINN